MIEKICYRCGDKKPIEDFNKNKGMIDGHINMCKICEHIITKEYSHTKDGLIARIYAHQKHQSKIRGHEKPCYTKNQLKIWLYKQEIFHKIFNEWEMSNYNIKLTPSCDRINNYNSYYFDNIQVTTWGCNKINAVNDRLNGRDSTCVPVIQKELSGKKVNTFHSISHAARETGIRRTNINKAILKQQKTSGGYIWEMV